MATPLQDERPPLTLVQKTPETAARFVVEKRPRPAWMLSRKQLGQWVVYARDNTFDVVRFHAAHSPYYLGWSVRGYRRLCLRWWEARQDDYRQQIATAKLMIKEAKAQPRGAARAADEAKARALRSVLRAEYRSHKKRHWIRTGISGLIVAAGTTTAVTMGSWWVQLLLALAVIFTGAYFGRPDEPAIAPVQAPTRTSHLGEETMRRVLVEAGAVPEKRGEEIRGVGIPHTEGPGIAYAVHTPSGIPAAVAVGKKQQIAAAMGVHSDWIDLSVGNIETLLLIWVASEDPFAVVRRSPLVGHKGGIDLWNDGAPLAFGKRGNTILSRLRDVMMLVAGATRRGKGMFIANLNLASAKDVRVNLRLFDGKASGEHNAFAGLLSTFVKKNPERLALFLRAVLEDLDRRADFLDERGKSKLTEDLIEAIGGIELIVIDELATFTSKLTSQFRDEIVESLCQIAAVGASLGVLLVCATQVPEVEVVPARLRQNLISRSAMNTESPSASNVILGDGMAGQGYDASLIPLNQPGRFWFKSPDLGTISLRTFLTEDDDKPPIIADAYELRKAAGRLPGQWRDPIEAKLTAWTGVSSAAGGERGNGRIVRVTLLERLELVAKGTGRDCATNAEVFRALAAAQAAKYGPRDGEADRAWSSRVGKVLKDEIEALGVELEAKKVSGVDGERTLGYALADITAARKARP
ncbi:FtsK/SpoIIIE domain-containing protein [Streptomyces sp. NPDC050597]|uniref:FtsK/SpoIIIE domain-containing protein n=1 Tax=Streptomyces sp. NPDC050597 TaxID=3157212 RepID=UPI00342C1B14